RLLAKSPADRPATAEEVAAALTAIVREAEAELPAATPVVREPGRRHHRWRRMVGGLVVLLAVGALTASLTSRWLTSRPTAGENPAPVDPVRGPGQATADSGSVRVVRLDVRHFAREAAGERLQGVLGEKSFTTRPGDSVTVEAALSGPAYTFLISFRPDGTD